MDKLPPYVYKRSDRSAYIWRPYVRGEPRREHRLCHINATLSEVYQAWLALQDTTPQGHTLEWLFHQYERSEKFNDLNPLSQKQAMSRHRVISQFPTKNGPFGKADLSMITPGVITNFMEKVREDGSGSPSRANTFRVAISTAWNWAVARDILSLDNPARRAQSFKSKRSTRYVTDEEYNLFYQLAKESRFSWLPSFMEIAYICRLRKTEVISLRHEHCLEEGLLCHRLKGSDTNIIKWSPRLRAAIMQGSGWLVHRKDGTQLTDNRVFRGWTEVMNQPAYNLEKFTAHHLKSKGMSDTDVAYRRASAGHRTEASAAIYDRVIDEIEPVV